MKDKKLIQDEVFERRWLHHAKNESAIFEADEIKKALKEGWKFWPWEVVKKEEKVKTPSVSEKLKEIYEEDKKEELSPVVIEERDFPGSSNPEVTVINDSLPAIDLTHGVDKTKEIK
jgi:hypothetical protein